MSDTVAPPIPYPPPGDSQGPHTASGLLHLGPHAPTWGTSRRLRPSPPGASRPLQDFEEIRDRSNFWSSKGIMDSVPKVKGIITPKGSGAGQTSAQALGQAK